MTDMAAILRALAAGPQTTAQLGDALSYGQRSVRSRCAAIDRLLPGLLQRHSGGRWSLSRFGLTVVGAIDRVVARQLKATRAEEARLGRPTGARLAKGDLVEATELDPLMGRVIHHKRRDTVAILAANSSLSRREVVAAGVLRDLAERAALAGLAASDMAGSGAASTGAGRVALTDAQLDARRRIDDLAALFGGRGSPGGSILRAVLCEGMSLPEWVANQSAGQRRSMNVRHAAGIVVLVLGVVAAHLELWGWWGKRLPVDGGRLAVEGDTEGD